MKSFVNQLLKLLPTNDIIILDNNSTYPKLHKYYDDIERKLGDRMKIIRLQKNYGHEVYLTRKDLLPNVYILSDPDLQLNPSMPNNASNILFDISNKYEVFKVGLSLDITDSDKFESIPNYFLGKNIKEWESQFYEKKINDTNIKLELYNASLDTTFTLVNWDYYKENLWSHNTCCWGHLDFGIRVAGNFTAKHLPWYKNYMANHIPEIELKYIFSNKNIASITLSGISETKRNTPDHLSN